MKALLYLGLSLLLLTACREDQCHVLKLGPRYWTVNLWYVDAVTNEGLIRYDASEPGRYLADDIVVYVRDNIEREPLNISTQRADDSRIVGLQIPALSVLEDDEVYDRHTIDYVIQLSATEADTLTLAFQFRPGDCIDALDLISADINGATTTINDERDIITVFK